MDELKAPEQVTSNAESADVLTAKQGKVTGIIIPPPEIRAVVDKTAQFVARNGKSFENKILNSSEGKTAKFNFMKVYDPYHAYYESKIREFEEKINGPADLAVTQNVPQEQKKVQEDSREAVPPTKAAVVSSSMISKASIASPLARFAMNKPTEAPLPFEFTIHHPPGLSALDVDVIKLTAQFTVVNGREFLGGLATREQRNPQFDFLKPTHMLFSYFTALVDAYAKILQPSPEQRARVKQRRERMSVLEAAVHRWEWDRAEEERKRREAVEADAERDAFQSIDWYDFVVVETITFGDDELLEVAGLRIGGAVTEEMDMEDDMETDAPGPPPPPQRPQQNLPPPPDVNEDMEFEEDDPDIRVVSDYQPRAGGPTKAAPTMIDPISGRALPVSEMSEHMRIQLMDPRWREEQRRFEEKQKGTGYAAGVSIADSLKSFAKRRGDIFGSTEEEERMLLEEREGRKRRAEDANRVIWDGHQASAAATQMAKDAASSRLPPPAPVPVSNIGPAVPSQSLPAMPSAPPPPPQPQMLPPVSFAGGAMSVPSMMSGLGVPPPPPQPPLMMGLPPMGIPPPPPPPVSGMGLPMGLPLGLPVHVPGFETEPSSKKLKAEPDLIPEAEFAARYPSRITVHISLPPDVGNGQVLAIELAVLTQVKDLKDMISERIGGLPTNKFQLKGSAGYLKDGQSLASFNIGDGVMLEFSLRSRGGKR